jgi:type IV secretion system protein TrbC
MIRTPFVTVLKYAPAILALSIIALALLHTDPVFASEGSGGGLPYESWLEKFRNSITGPTAFTFGILGIVTAGAILIFGGELNGFMRTFVFIILVMALIVSAQNIMSGLFGRGAELTAWPAWFDRVGYC